MKEYPFLTWVLHQIVEYAPQYQLGQQKKLLPIQQ